MENNEQPTQALAILPPGAVEVNGALVFQDSVIPGMEDYDPSMFRLPRIRIVQTMAQITEWKAQGGQFYNDVTAEVYPTLEGVTVISAQPGRWYGPDFETSKAMRDSGQEVAAWCKSSNGQTPDAGMSHPQSPSCKTCPRAKFQKVDGQTKAPECTEIRKLLLKLADESFGMLTVRKEAVKSVNAFAQPFFLQNRPLFTMRANITTKAEKNGDLMWFVPQLVPRKDLVVPLEEQRALYDALQGFKAMMTVDANDGHGEDMAPVQEPPAAAPPAQEAPAPAPSAPPPAESAEPPAIDVQAEAVAPTPPAPEAPAPAAAPPPVAPTPPAPPPVASAGPAAPAAPTESATTAVLNDPNAPF